MEAHAQMDMSVPAVGSFWHRAIFDNGRTATSHYFVIDFASVWIDIVGGLLIVVRLRRGYRPLEPWSFDSIYGAWPEALIKSGWKQILARGVSRYVDAVSRPASAVRRPPSGKAQRLSA